MASLAISGIGAVTPVGLSAPASAAAFRASIARMGALLGSAPHGPEGNTPPSFGGRVPLEWFAGGPRIQDWPGHERFEMPIPPADHLMVEDGTERLLRLAIPAAVESCRQALGQLKPPADWGLYLGMSPDEDPSSAPRLAESLRHALEFQPAQIEIIAEGRAAGLAALHEAAQAISSGKIAGAIVGGVDSLIRPATYARLVAANFVKNAANPHGVLPGEAAAFCVLERQPRRGTPLAFLAQTAVAVEPTAGTDQANQAQGLTTALRAIRAALSYQPLVICDLNGDRYRALEWGFALTRVFGNLPENSEITSSGEFWHPADCIGDTGAASGLVDCVWAVEALRKKYAQTNHVLVWGASESSRRAAVLLAAQN